MDRDQRSDEKNGVVCLVIMFTPRVFKMLEFGSTLYFLLVTAKNLSQFGQYIVLAENDAVNRL